MKKKGLYILSIIIFIVSFSISVYGFYTSIRSISSGVSIGKIRDGKVVLSRYDTQGQAHEISNGDIGYVDGTLTCYASELKSYDTSGYFEFRNIAATISYSAEIDTRLRIKIQDVWISNKVYSSGVEMSTVIAKNWGAENARNPFSFVGSDWTYDISSGYVYYNNTVKKSENISFDFLNNYGNNFFYETTTGAGYRESILVQLNFQIDVVQANRAEAVWGVEL